LLVGYAKNQATIDTEIIDGVAHDLRLGVVASDPKSNGLHLSKEKEQNDLLLTVKKLLEVHGRLQEADMKRRLQ
jgi:hypothetical protein